MTIVRDTIDISFDEFTASMTVARKYLEESEEGLLTDEELDMVAGGKMTQGAQELLVLAGGVVLISAAAGAVI